METSENKAYLIIYLINNNTILKLKAAGLEYRHLYFQSQFNYQDASSCGIGEQKLYAIIYL